MSAWDKVSVTIHDFNIPLCHENVYTMKEMSDLTSVSVQTLNRLDRKKVFEARRVEHNNRVYRYYTESQYQTFIKSDVYLNMPMVKNRDLIHTTIGKLYVRDFSDSARKKGYYGSYICECECGNIVELARSELLNGKHLSCGCRFHDLTGKTFGYWHVDSLAEPSYTQGGFKLIRYNCTCKCGTKRIIIARSLTSGASQSCGCLRDEIAMSKYEFSVRNYLESLGLTAGLSDDKRDGYVQHKTYDDLVGLGGHRLSYDFLVMLHDKCWLIECQGGQHYFPVDLWGGVEAFEKQKEHDYRKREYAVKLGITLVEIPYYAFKFDDVVKILQESGIRL